MFDLCRKVVLVIDTLGSGGAQRQMAELAKLLAENGVSVKVIAYYPNCFYESELRAAGVSVSMPSVELGKVKRLLFVRSEVLSFSPDVVCAFLSAPGVAVELLRLSCFQRFRLVVSERHSDSKVSLSIYLRLLLHSIADCVVANSNVQRNFIYEHAPWLRKKLSCIRNCVDLDRYRPSDGNSGSDLHPVFRVLVLASYTQNKNPAGLVRAVKVLRDSRPDLNVHVSWYGNPFVSDGLGGSNDEPFQMASRLMREYGLESAIELNGQTKDVDGLYRSANIFCLPSYSEATPNVICEALACGLPIVASQVGDIPDLVFEGENGFLFDPNDPVSIAGALVKCCELSNLQRSRMSEVNRHKAECLLGARAFVDQYMSAFQWKEGVV